MRKALMDTWKKLLRSLEKSTSTCFLNVKNIYLKVENSYFVAKQRVELKKQRKKDRRDRVNARFLEIAKFIYFKYADVKNNENYEPTKLYLVLLGITSLIFSFVVFCYKHGDYVILLGTGIAVTVALAQYYTEWFFKLKKKYGRKK